MADDHGERLARIEEGIKSLGRSVDQLRSNFDRHTEEEARLEEAVNNIQTEMATVRGGYKMFWKMCGGFAVVGAATWAVATWVSKNG
jgi:hypothetical protein